MVQALIMIAVTGLAEPMIRISDNCIQIFNEFSVLIFCYHLLPLTDFMTDQEARNLVGKRLILVTQINLGVNMLLATAQNSSPYIRRVLQWNRKRKYRKGKLMARQENVRLYISFLTVQRDWEIFAPLAYLFGFKLMLFIHLKKYIDSFSLFNRTNS